jgi:branched-chain amino acid transport system permease protein
MPMNEILIINGLIGGILFGAIYALIGASLNIMYGVLRILNFAHGEFIIAGSFIGYAFMNATGLNPLFSLPIVIIIFSVAGFGLYYILVPRLAKSDDPETSSFLLMFGVSLIMVSVITWIFEADIRPVLSRFDPVNVTLLTIKDAFGEGRHGRIIIPTARIVAFAVNILIVGILTWFLYRTIPGKALRAAIMNRDAIQIIGININRLSAIGFGLSAMLAGVTGVTLMLVVPTIDPNVGPALTLVGFVVIVLGGLGHPVGALLAGVLFGIIEQMANTLVSQLAAQMIGFIIIVVVIFIRPYGLLGKGKAGGVA